MNLEPLFELYSDSLRIRIAILVLIVSAWSTVWFYRFFRDWWNGTNGATFALWVFFVVMALERLIEGIGFGYLVSPWVKPLITTAILQARELLLLAVIISLGLLQWRFTSGSKDKDDHR